MKLEKNEDIKKLENGTKVTIIKHTDRGNIPVDFIVNKEKQCLVNDGYNLNFDELLFMNEFYEFDIDVHMEERDKYCALFGSTNGKVTMHDICRTFAEIIDEADEKKKTYENIDRELTLKEINDIDDDEEHEKQRIIWLNNHGGLTGNDICQHKNCRIKCPTCDVDY